MIDNISIRVNTYLPKPVHGRLFHYITLRSENVREVYKLKAKNNNPFQLTVIDYGDCFHINGSIRKFYLGKYTLKDLQPQDLFFIVEDLAQVLDVTENYIWEAILIKMEYGKTYNLYGTTCRSIVNKIFSYSTFSPVQEGTTVTFKGQDFQFKLYDKVKEVISKKPALKNELFATNKLRIELRLKDQKGVREKGRGITSLKDVWNNYRMLTVTYLNEINRLQFKSEDEKYDSITFENKNIKDLKQYLIYKGILSVGVDETFRCIQELDCSIQGKSLYKGQFRNILSELEHLSQYGKKELLKDVRRELAREISNPLLNSKLL